MPVFIRVLFFGFIASISFCLRKIICNSIRIFPITSLKSNVKRGTPSNSHFDVKRPGLKQTNPLYIKGDSGCFRR
ncbi:MAG: hypothetical protein BWK80_34185 [Desulfobacteraceae bacterium IS3]|nr:MAG: hypothetical protein BWK80_34185 [Desulfobacteraceae bacterium IS3]